MTVTGYLKRFYNRERLYQALSYESPGELEYSCLLRDLLG